MKLYSILLVSSSLVVGVGVYYYASGGSASGSGHVDERAVQKVGAPNAIAVARPVEAAFTVTASAVVDTPPGNASRWAAEVHANDAHRRAEAIGALASAPAAEAVPLLKSVLISGESVIDRPLALRSLRDIAVRDGDLDGAIRDMMRRASHQSDNEVFSRQAQAALDDLEMLLEAR